VAWAARRGAGRGSTTAPGPGSGKEATARGEGPAAAERLGARDAIGSRQSARAVVDGAFWERRRRRDGSDEGVSRPGFGEALVTLGDLRPLDERKTGANSLSTPILSPRRVNRRHEEDWPGTGRVDELLERETYFCRPRAQVNSVATPKRIYGDELTGQDGLRG